MGGLGIIVVARGLVVRSILRAFVLDFPPDGRLHALVVELVLFLLIERLDFWALVVDVFVDVLDLWPYFHFRHDEHVIERDQIRIGAFGCWRTR